MDGDVEVGRVVLAVLERDEAVDGDVIEGRAVPHHSGVEEDRVPAESVDLAVDGGRRDTQIVGDLTVAERR
ncbi:MAG: hypothetical protein R3D98_15235 [Candidatus Krumholzibacteriia bacterium]